MKIMMQKQTQPNNKDTHTKTPILLVNEDYDAKANPTQQQGHTHQDSNFVGK
jgi:hypothetical protein